MQIDDEIKSKILQHLLCTKIIGLFVFVSICLMMFAENLTEILSTL